MAYGAFFFHYFANCFSADRDRSFFILREIFIRWLISKVEYFSRYSDFLRSIDKKSTSCRLIR